MPFPRCLRKKNLERFARPLVLLKSDQNIYPGSIQRKRMPALKTAGSLSDQTGLDVLPEGTLSSWIWQPNVPPVLSPLALPFRPPRSLSRSTDDSPVDVARRGDPTVVAPAPQSPPNRPRQERPAPSTRLVRNSKHLYGVRVCGDGEPCWCCLALDGENVESKVL